jgi:hypothetical protein
MTQPQVRQPHSFRFPGLMFANTMINRPFLPASVPALHRDPTFLQGPVEP